MVVSDTAVFAYKCTEYHPETRAALCGMIRISALPGPISVWPLLSDKDTKHPASGFRATTQSRSGLLATGNARNGAFELLPRAVFRYRNGREVDITNQDALNAFAAEYKPEYIVNCAAYTAVDKAEEDRELCRALNADGAGNIARAANRAGARLVHISTDYVFNGNGTRPYREDDPTDPTGVYGLTKRDGEVFVLQENPESWIIRTAWLYGQHGNNFVHTMLRLMGERDELRVVNDQFGSPTWALILPVLWRILSFCVGLVHQFPLVFIIIRTGRKSWLFCPGNILTREAIRYSGFFAECYHTPVFSAEFPAKVRRPPYSVLDKSKNYLF